jgi:hypothetical protein
LILSVSFFVAEIAFFDTRRFTAQLTQVVKFRAAHTTAANDVDMIDDRRMERENSFNADAERDFANRHGFARAAVFAGDDDAFKNLQAFLVAFLDANVNLRYRPIETKEYYLLIVFVRCCLNDSFYF